MHSSLASQPLQSAADLITPQINCGLRYQLKKSNFNETLQTDVAIYARLLKYWLPCKIIICLFNLTNSTNFVATTQTTNTRAQKYENNNSHSDTNTK